MNGKLSPSNYQIGDRLLTPCDGLGEVIDILPIDIDFNPLTGNPIEPWVYRLKLGQGVYPGVKSLLYYSDELAIAP